MGDAPPPATDSWSRFLAAQTACMNLALELRPTYGSMVREYVDLGTIFADAPIEIRARAQEDRLQMLKSPILFPQLPFQTTMPQHSRLVRFRVQESPTQPQNHPLIVFAINEDKCSVKSRDESLVSSLLFGPEPNGPKFGA